MATVGIIEVLAVIGRQRMSGICLALGARSRAARQGVAKETAKLLVDGTVREQDGVYSLTWHGLRAAQGRFAAKQEG